MSKSAELNHIKREFISNRKLMILSLTKRCNLSCVYCRVTPDEWYDMLSKDSELIDFPEDRWEDLVEYYRKNNVAEILLTGGEPIEYPLIDKFLLFLKKNDIVFSIHTNGMSLKWSGILDFMFANNLKPNIHLSTELFKEHQAVLRGADLPLELIEKAISSGFLVELKVTLNALLLCKIKELTTVFEKWINTGIVSIRFQPIVPLGDNFDNSLLLDEEFVPVVEFIRNYQNQEPLAKDVFRNSSFSYQALIDCLRGVHSKCFAECNALDGIVFITPDFQFLNCKSLWNKDEKKSCDELFDLVCCGFLS